MCHFYYGNVHKNKHKCFSVNDLHETKPLVACNEFPNGCSPQKDQVLDVGVILTQI
jgi:hypothetical protein